MKLRFKKGDRVRLQKELNIQNLFCSSGVIVAIDSTDEKKKLYEICFVSVSAALVDEIGELV